MIAIDISYWQHNPNFAQVHAAGIGLVVMKMGGAEPGRLYSDSVYKANRAAARAVGLAVGSYFFNGAVNPTDAANFQMNNVDWKSGDVVALDVENATNVARWNPAQVLEWCRAVLTRGVPANRILVYMSSSVTRAANWSAVAALGVGLWVAQYGTNNGSPQGSPSIAYWSSWALWQYTSAKTWPGIAGFVDTNLVAAAWAAGSGTPIEEVDMTPEQAQTLDNINWMVGQIKPIIYDLNGSAGPGKSVQAKLDLVLWALTDSTTGLRKTAGDISTKIDNLAAPVFPADLAAQIAAAIKVPVADVQPVLDALAALKVPTADENGAAARAAIIK